MDINFLGRKAEAEITKIVVKNYFQNWKEFF